MTSTRCWRGQRDSRFRVMLLLAFFIHLQSLTALQWKHTRDWTVCSWNGYAGPLILQSQQQICPLASDWSLWSHQPICPEPAEDDYDSEPLSPDCVFTLAAFRGNQGISLITTPHLAASLADQLDDSRVSPRLRHQLASGGHSQQNDNVAYEIREVPGRGKGVLAKRKFEEHETVMVGFPVLVVRLDFINGDRYSTKQKRHMMEASVKQLPPEQQKAIGSLARNTGGEPILDAFRTNGFGIEIDGIQHLALFTDGSRVNHNCRPNSYWRYVNGDIAMEVVALRDIQPGQEVAHSCKNQPQPVVETTAHLYLGRCSAGVYLRTTENHPSSMGISLQVRVVLRAYRRAKRLRQTARTPARDSSDTEPGGETRRPTRRAARNRGCGVDREGRITPATCGVLSTVCESVPDGQ
ncbi:uncharacterized protein B0H64DRAFT_367960 [Chaetomium fimeti]|uniref:SET domain-containing protein n=1 Tax=Chaetomium fimeti TaxID=1854472 RepID=A0AAE0LMF3_9PEZI|nr:hypothetical protein B0H64DRAFT_367960 [Chaetomium fimeti]